MKNFPIIITDRLTLRAFKNSDASTVKTLANDKKIADTTLDIPYPYPDGLAEAWIASHEKAFEVENKILWAIINNEENLLLGTIGLMIKPEFKKAEFGFWIGQKYWNNGYASEALSAVVKYGFEELQLNKIFAHHFVDNFSSGKVMIKNNLREEGYLREDVIKEGKFIDIKIYSILRREYLANKTTKNNLIK